MKKDILASEQTKNEKLIIQQLKSTRVRDEILAPLSYTFIAFLKKNVLVPHKRLSAVIIAYCEISPPLTSVITAPVDKDATNETAKENGNVFFTQADLSAKTPSDVIRQAAAYLKNSCFPRHNIYPRTAPTAEKIKLLLLHTLIKAIANGEPIPITEPVAKTSDNKKYVPFSNI